MARAALTLEVLAKQWRLGLVDALAICGHPHGCVAVASAVQATQIDRWFYCLYGRREGAWEVVREAQNSALRGRTWWSLDQCLQALQRRHVVPGEVRLLPRGPRPEDFPVLPVETTPTESARRKPVVARKPPAGKARGPKVGPASWLDEVGYDDDAVGTANRAAQPPGGGVGNPEGAEKW